MMKLLNMDWQEKNQEPVRNFPAIPRMDFVISPVKSD
jgi:hypothetical protein